MLPPGLGGVTWSGRGQNQFPSATANAAGNNLPGITGPTDAPFRPAPGYWHVGGQLGGIGDGNTGADPRAPKIAPKPVSPRQPAWGEGQTVNPPGTNEGPVPYGGAGSDRRSGIDQWGWAQQTTNRF